MKEQQIQKFIIDYLRLKGWFVYKNSTVGIYKQSTGKYIPAQMRGVADLTAIKDGHVVQIEIKRPGGKQSENQIIFADDWMSHGGHYVVIHDIDEVMGIRENTILN